MTQLEIREALADYKTELNAIITNGEAEARELTEDETNKLAELRTKIDEATAEIERLEEENRKINNTNNKIEKKSNNMKLVDLINAVVNGNATDEQRQYIDGNKITFRSQPDAIQAKVATAGQENVPEDKTSLQVAIRNASILNKLGVTWIGNAVGDVSIPKYAGSTTAWASEVSAATNGAGEFSEVVLSPKRLTCYVDISKMFLAQDANDAEALIIRDLADAVSMKLDQTVFGTAASSTTQPGGLLYSAETHVITASTDLSAVTYEDILAHEEAVELKNGTDFTFVVNPKVKYHLKAQPVAAGISPMVYSGNEIDGYPMISSNSVAENGLVCLDPRDLVVAVWGGNTEILVDPYTRAAYGEIRLVVNYYTDAKLRGDRISAQVYA